MRQSISLGCVEGLENFAEIVSTETYAAITHHR